MITDMSRKAMVVCVAVVLFVAAAAPSCFAQEAFIPPDGVFEGEAGTLYLKYLGEGAVEIRLRSSDCFYEEPGVTTVTHGPHLVHSFHNQDGLILVIFHEQDYAVVSAVIPAFANRFCSHGSSDATGYYPRVK